MKGQVIVFTLEVGNGVGSFFLFLWPADEEGSPWVTLAKADKHRVDQIKVASCNKSNEIMSRHTPSWCCFKSILDVKGVENAMMNETVCRDA